MTSASKPSTPSKPSKPAIILLEDDECLSELFKVTLEHNGFELICAPNSKDILNLYHKHHPVLIITDLMMPDHEGMEGIFRLRKISDIPVIAMSVNTTFLKMSEDLVTLTLAKPFSADFLLANIRQVLQKIS
jgi:DNA-binding response OmpR family regulator